MIYNSTHIYTYELYYTNIIQVANAIQSQMHVQKCKQNKSWKKNNKNP